MREQLFFALLRPGEHLIASRLYKDTILPFGNLTFVHESRQLLKIHFRDLHHRLFVCRQRQHQCFGTPKPLSYIFSQVASLAELL